MTKLLFDFLIAVAVVLAAAAIIAFIVANVILGLLQGAKGKHQRGKYLSAVGEDRRELLSEIADDLKKRTPLIGLSDTLDTTSAELIPLVKEFGFEGSSPSAGTPAMSPVSAAAPGSSTRTTKHRSS